MATLLDRSLKNLRGAWRDLFGRDPGRPRDPDLASNADREQLKARMAECLDGKGGEVTARARAVELGRFYQGLSETGRREFLRLLASGFAPDPAAVDQAARAVIAAAPENRAAAEAALAAALEAPRARLLRQFNARADGTRFLVDLRADLLKLRGDEAPLRALEGELKRLLASWFDVGFLDLRRITWDAPASLLEKLTLYEAVHEIHGWNDLKNRLDTDRRCFAFFHPRMPAEPLIFVEVALVAGLADRIDTLLDVAAPVGDPADADTAIFYSISNTQRGLDGIGFGGFLIKRVVDQLSAELPRLKNFATLSPIPGFARWAAKQEINLTKAERKALAAALEVEPEAADVRDALARPDWHDNAAFREALRGPVLRLIARYLLQAKRPNGNARDPVAHFHLSNGARIERLNWLADVSAKGLAQSWGVMVNYAYRQGEIEANHEAYVGEGEIAAANPVLALGKT